MKVKEPKLLKKLRSKLSWKDKTGKNDAAQVRHPTTSNAVASGSWLASAYPAVLCRGFASLGSCVSWLPNDWWEKLLYRPVPVAFQQGCQQGDFPLSFGAAAQLAAHGAMKGSRSSTGPLLTLCVARVGLSSSQRCNRGPEIGFDSFVVVSCGLKIFVRSSHLKSWLLWGLPFWEAASS